MKNKFIQLLLCIGMPVLLHAQQPKKKAGCGCSFSSINQIGLLQGSKGGAFQIQTINGLGYKTWFAGIGVGLDNYQFRTVPLFADVRKDLFNKLNTPFFYADAGIHLPWVVDKQKGDMWGSSNSYNKGLYYDAGVGYSLNMGKGRAFIFSGGFILKNIRQTRKYEVVCVTFPCPSVEDYYDFSLKRFSVKAGLRL